MERNNLRSIAVWFKDGTFRFFPKVQFNTASFLHDGLFSFVFGEHEHEAVINLSNVLFTETMDYTEHEEESHN